MKNLELLYAQVEQRGLTFEKYLEYAGSVIPSQALFKLESCEDDTGFLLRSDDGSYHIWFVSRSIDKTLYYITQTGIWYANQLNEAMGDLMLQMKLDCQGLIERNGESRHDHNL